jgi:hypothetical protein
MLFRGLGSNQHSRFQRAFSCLLEDLGIMAVLYQLSYQRAFRLPWLGSNQRRGLVPRSGIAPLPPAFQASALLFKLAGQK